MLSWIKEHRYCLAGLYLFVFLAGFFLLELLVPEPKYVIHCTLDDWIPFNEWFVLPYFLWYVWVPVFLLYFVLKDKWAYLELCFLMFTGATLCLIIYALWPNGLDLRREITSHNFCADIVRFLRRIDSPCNVCPSIHVSSTVAVHIAICHSRSFEENRGMKLLSLAVTLAICASTVFIKQHSVIDVFWGWLLSCVLGMGSAWYRQKQVCSAYKVRKSERTLIETENINKIVRK